MAASCLTPKMLCLISKHSVEIPDQVGNDRLVRKDGKFPETEIENNREMRKRGIQCAKMEEKKLWGKKNRKNSGECNSDCGSCGLGC